MVEELNSELRPAAILIEVINYLSELKESAMVE
jgi:hypothetical protein